MTTYTLDDLRTECLAALAARKVPAHRVPARSEAGLFTRLWVAAYRAWQRARSRHEMRLLSEETLKDVGLSRADVEREASKPFWR